MFIMGLKRGDYVQIEKFNDIGTLVDSAMGYGLPHKEVSSINNFCCNARFGDKHVSQEYKVYVCCVTEETLSSEQKARTLASTIRNTLNGVKHKTCDTKQLVDTMGQLKQAGQARQIEVYDDGVWRIQVSINEMGVIRFFVERETKDGSYAGSYCTVYSTNPPGLVVDFPLTSIKSTVRQKIVSVYKSLMKAGLVEVR